MTYQQASRLAIIKQILGWGILIPALLSTLISLLTYLADHSRQAPGIDAVLNDFIRVMVDMARSSTPILNLFWHHSPQLDFNHSMNIGFWIVYLLIFVGAALHKAGARMWRQSRVVKEHIEDQLLIEQAKEKPEFTPAELIARIQIPNRPFYKQVLMLYCWPIILALLGYFLLDFSGLIY